MDRTSEATPLLADSERSLLAEAERFDSTTSDASSPYINEIGQQTSVYAYMLFMPEISRKRHGHFCTFQNLNACILFVVVVTLQLSLTIISGLYIMENHIKWKSSIIHDQRDIYSGLSQGTDLLLHPHHAFQMFKHKMKKRSTTTEEDCCPDSTCAGTGRKCCKHGFNASGSDALVQVGTNLTELDYSKSAINFEKGDGDKAHASKNALCTIRDAGTYSCSPPSLRYLDMWDKLDHNGDGVWTRAEALQDAENLGCQLHVSQEDMFHSVCRTIIMDIKDGATYRGVQKTLPLSIKKKREVPRKYFEWFRGVVALCSTTSPGHCTSLLQKDVFTSAMDPDQWFGVGLHTIDDSIEYCNRLLSPGENLGCQLHVSQEDMFHAVCRTIIMDIEDGATYRGVQKVVPQHIKERRAVPRKYFEWFQGMAALCSTTSPGHCTSLLQKDVFTSAMDPDQWFGVGLHTIDDSIEYCNRLLSPGGLCGKMMPSSYSLYSSMVDDKCGALTYTMGSMYRNPHDPHDGIRILHPTFSKVGEFTETTSTAFEFFLLLLLMTWFFNSMEEMKNIGAVFDLLVNFPVINVFPFMPEQYREKVNKRISRMSVRMGELIREGESQHSLNVDKKALSIDCISRPHQMTLGCMVFIRLSLLIYMTIVGTIFLLSNHHYLDLLLNAVALAFIFELDEFIFTFLVSDEVKKQLEQIKPIRFESSMPTNGFASLFFRRELWAAAGANKANPL
eukprot:CAMPEP_0172927916 /NCGR_PEP_ID=MMETSP1075-20121228/217711_1 /TAXON_ID=2916 /ORGANISM="Ceratium fusus, Strain PA161109" /LENGTH=730 /DNA_ID=CAMNT_0013789193 /DNA_START=21 /DNA_END=2213 /DNA_ORIENTATION=-